MAASNLITVERLKSVIRYEPRNGNLYRYTMRNRKGRIAGHKEKGGYVEVMIDGRIHPAHRLAWLYMTGEWPKGQIDHIDGDKWNNKWTNLRDVTGSINAQNRKRANKGRKHKLPLGVYKDGDAFMALLWMNKKRYRLGTFATAKEAHETYLDARRLFIEGNTL